MNERFIGKHCPYCKGLFQEGDEIVVCSICEMPHHKECWIENKACTTFGCTGTITYPNGVRDAIAQQIVLEDEQPWRCNSCGMSNRPTSDFCTRCGQRKTAPQPAMTRPSNAVFCTSCGARCSDQNAFCTHCGAPLRRQVSAAPVVQPSGIPQQPVRQVQQATPYAQPPQQAQAGYGSYAYPQARPAAVQTPAYPSQPGYRAAPYQPQPGYAAPVYPQQQGYQQMPPAHAQPYPAQQGYPPAYPPAQTYPQQTAPLHQQAYPQQPQAPQYNAAKQCRVCGALNHPAASFCTTCGGVI